MEAEMLEDDIDGAVSPNPHLYHGAVGLANLGNTCYINASVQALAACPPFSAVFLECIGYITIPRRSRHTFTPALRKLIGTLRTGVERTTWFSPNQLIRLVRRTSPIFSGYQQHDAEEFLKFLIDRLDQELVLSAIEPEAEDEEGEQEAEGGGGGVKGGAKRRGRSAASNGHAHPSEASGIAMHPAEAEHSEVECSGEAAMAEDSAAATAAGHNGGRRSPPSHTGEATRKRAPYSAIRDLFGGKTATVVQCTRCSSTSIREEDCEGLQLALSKPFQEEAEGEPDGGGQENLVESLVSGSLWFARQVLPIETLLGPLFPDLVYGEQEHLVLEECLENFFAEERMVDDNQYECEHCKGKQDAHRRLFLTRPPELLMVTLKRFEYTSRGARKLNQPVQFPLSGLDLTRFLRRKGGGLPEPCSYHLCAMITHRGLPFGGHYFTYAYSEADEQWYCYDDDDVYRVSARTVAAEQAYILLYQRGATRKAEMTPLSQVVAEEAEAAAAEGDPMGLISRRWLALADTMHTPPPIDNRDFICQHGRLLPDRAPNIVDLAAEIPVDTYAALADQYGVRSDSVIDATHVCETCSDELKAVNARRAAEAQMLDGVPGRPQVCLLHKEWADAWEAFVTSSALDIPPPGEISNRALIGHDGNLRKGLAQNVDFVMVSAGEWLALEGVYGGGPCMVYTNNEVLIDPDPTDPSVEDLLALAHGHSQEESPADASNAPGGSAAMAEDDPPTTADRSREPVAEL